MFRQEFDVAMKRVRVVPAVEQLAFSILVPEDFRQVPVPTEIPDFSDPAAMMPLGVFMAGYAAVLCSVAARPLKADGSDGSVMEMATRLAQSQLAEAGGQVKQLMPVRKWGTTAVEVEAVQPSEVGEMTVRVAFFEDGGTLYNIGMMAPAALWGSVEKTLVEMVESFSLMAAQGPMRGIVPGEAPPARAVFSDAGEAQPGANKGSEGGPDLRAYAMEDAGALDPEEKINARFRDAGAGLVPRVLMQNERCVVVGLGALEATLPVPMGWHVVDDGRRSLIFDSGNKVQVNLNLITMDGRSPADIFNEVLDDLRKGSPGVEHRTFEIGQYNAMQVRNLVIDGTPLQQAYLVRPHPSRENLVLKVRVTATEENMSKAMDMTGAMLEGISLM